MLNTEVKDLVEGWAYQIKLPDGMRHLRGVKDWTLVRFKGVDGNNILVQSIITEEIGSLDIRSVNCLHPVDEDEIPLLRLKYSDK